MKHDHLHVGYIVVLVLALSLYAGCSGQTTSQVSDYRYGSQALEMRFASGTQNQVYDKDNLALVLELRNRGTSDITDGELYLSGFDSKYLPFTIDPSPSFELKGKDQFDPRGDFTDVFMLNARVNSPRSVDRFPQTVQVTACYTYETSAVANVCIDSDPNNRLSRAKACTMSSVSVGGQGHPVVVTSVEPIVSSDKIRFNIRLSNSGSGIVYNPQMGKDSCAQGPDYSNLNRVRLGKVTLGGVHLDCNPQGIIWLNSGSASVSCECAGSDCIDKSVPAYKTLLEMHFIYGYRDTISTQLTVINPN